MQSSRGVLTAWVDAMPGFMPAVQRIVAMSGEMGSSPRDLVHVIETDPVVMIKVLKVVNSAHYGYGKNITSVDQAVVLPAAPHCPPPPWC
jgi:HD-like signal output (HDOD) protein